ncbi:hypothetical protein BpHYR1_023159 [Brachionus plicatilis]|uniref:Uncharacterized protein n=1 Tax=Brachionus plicatilis TaxID=10195 RepID=A0A3M7SYM8_BRAPC|nr:hypothetical protein BpHYR1_023159 [Brachionus plicatilis]
MILMSNSLDLRFFISLSHNFFDLACLLFLCFILVVEDISSTIAYRIRLDISLSLEGDLLGLFGVQVSGYLFAQFYRPCFRLLLDIRFKSMLKSPNIQISAELPLVFQHSYIPLLASLFRREVFLLNIQVALRSYHLLPKFPQLVRLHNLSLRECL